jgi:hypothetical protein
MIINISGNNILSFEAAKIVIDTAKYIDFSQLPIKGLTEFDAMAKSSIGLIPWVTNVENQQSKYHTECLVGAFINNLIEYYKEPYEFDQPFQITDFFKPHRLSKEEFEHWLPVYQYLKHKNHLL